MPIYTKVPSVGWKQSHTIKTNVPSLGWREAKKVHKKISGVWKLVHERYDVGDIGPGGFGKVYYTTNNGLTGYVSPPSNWAGGVDRTAQWSSVDNPVITNGDGYYNTYSVLLGTAYGIAEICRNYAGGGFTDWFLPNDGELYNFLLGYQAGYCDAAVANQYYATSNSVDSHNFGVRNSTTRVANPFADKTASWYFRPVRKFDFT